MGGFPHFATMTRATTAGVSEPGPGLRNALQVDPKKIGKSISFPVDGQTAHEARYQPWGGPQGGAVVGC